MNPAKQYISMSTRSAVIIIHNNALLLMYRQRNGQIFYAFPGGTVEPGEDIADAAVRELLEETTVVGKLNRLVYRLHLVDLPLEKGLGCRDEYFFVCDYISGEPRLPAHAEEAQRTTSNNVFKPMWIPLDEVQGLQIFPVEIKDLLLNHLKTGFPSEPLRLQASRAELQKWGF